MIIEHLRVRWKIKIVWGSVDFGVFKLFKKLKFIFVIPIRVIGNILIVKFFYLTNLNWVT